MKAFILDLNFLKEQNISPEEFLVLIGLNNNLDVEHSKSWFPSLEVKGFIKRNNSEIILREKTKLLLNFLSIESDLSRKEKKTVKKVDYDIVDEFDEFIEKYRNIWKGLKPGSLGSYRTCYDKMKRWMIENPNYSKEDILKAARIYIKSLDNYQYLQQADYFIFKKDGKDENSRLSAFIDEKEVDNTDWTVKLN
jgi:hypothetical protein